MLEVLQHFEKTAGHFAPAVLIIPGAACILLGLIIWLAGLRYAKLIAACLGALIGGTCAFLATEGKAFAAVTLAIPAALFAVLIRKVILSAGAVLIAAVIALAVAAAGIESENHTTADFQYEQSDQKITTTEALAITKTHLRHLTQKAVKICSRLTTVRWAAVLVVAALTIAAAVFFHRVVIAAGCAALGAALSFVGMTILLLYKGSEPITRISDKVTFYGLVFAVMIVVGVCIQLLLHQPRRAKAGSDK